MNKKEFIIFKEELKLKINSHFKKIGYKFDDGNLKLNNFDKKNIRLAHNFQKKEKVEKSKNRIIRSIPKIKKYFADGKDICPKRISPELEFVESSTWQSDLFEIASMTWSIPVSVGYGRRIRMLVWDRYNDKLMGILAIKDPAINLSARDRIIGWDSNLRHNQLINVMDSYVVGAIPPYNSLLCGKLVACLLKTKEIKDKFNTKYNRSIGIISETKKNPKLVLITTSSALGRSSIYNRLKIDKEKFMHSVSYTEGFGHFHFSDSIIQDFKILFKFNDKEVPSFEFGKGSNWKWRYIKAALKILDIPLNTLNHGIKRELFFCPLAKNYLKILNGKQIKPNYSDLKTVKEVSELALDRWVLPRSLKDKSYQKILVNEVIRDNILGNNKEIYKKLV